MIVGYVVDILAEYALAANSILPLSHDILCNPNSNPTQA